MLAYKPKMRTIMIKNLSLDTPVDYYPKNELNDVICEMKEIIKSFEYCESGLIETRDALYHYATIQQQIKEVENEQIEGEENEIEEKGEKLFVIILTDPNYPEEACNSCIMRISDIFKSTNNQSNPNTVVISQFRKKMYDLFQEYNTTDADDLVSKFHKSAENTTLENTQGIYAAFNQDYNNNLIDKDDEIMIIDKGNEGSKELHNEDIFIDANKDEVKDDNNNNNNNQEEEGIDENNTRFNLNALLYQRLSPWKTIKIIYIIIWSVIIISVILSIIFLTQ